MRWCNIDCMGKDYVCSCGKARISDYRLSAYDKDLLMQDGIDPSKVRNPLLSRI